MENFFLVPTERSGPEGVDMSRSSRSRVYSGYDLWVGCGLAVITAGLAEILDGDEVLQLAGEISLALGGLFLIVDAAVFLRRDPAERYLGRNATIFLLAVVLLLAAGWLVKSALVGGLFRPSFALLGLWMFPVALLGWATLKVAVRNLFLAGR